MSSTDPEHAIIAVSLSIADAETEITERLATLPAQAVPPMLYQLTIVSKALDRLRAVIEAKADAGAWKEAVPDGTWTAPDGTPMEFGPTYTRKADDLEGFYADLVAATRQTAPHAGDVDTAALKFIGEAFPVKRELRLTPLDALARVDPIYENLIHEHVSWKRSGTAHLRPVERKGR